MRVAISKRAARAVERIDAWWKANADYPEVFAREFLHLVEELETTRGIGAAFPAARHPELRRAVLAKSRCHVYFERVEEVIRILHVWDGRRGRPPQL